MTEKEKYKKIIELKDNIDYLNKIEYKNTNEYNRIINLVINKKPENYSRERKGRGNHFYNPKSSEMNEFKNECRKKLSKEDILYLKELKDKPYNVSIDVKYFIPIPKNDSLKTSVLKELGQIKPSKKPDLDNYDKFLLDSLHDVFYDDDCCVVKINAEKLYSINPRTELTVKIKEE